MEIKEKTFRFRLKGFGRAKKVYINTNTYLINDRLAVGLLENRNGILYAHATVNLPNEELTNDWCAFVDENNLPGIGRWLEKNGIAKSTGRMGASGYCMYPEYDFSEFLMEAIL